MVLRRRRRPRRPPGLGASASAVGWCVLCVVCVCLCVVCVARVQRTTLFCFFSRRTLWQSASLSHTHAQQQQQQQQLPAPWDAGAWVLQRGGICWRFCWRWCGCGSCALTWDVLRASGRSVGCCMVEGGCAAVRLLLANARSRAGRLASSEQVIASLTVICRCSPYLRSPLLLPTPTPTPTLLPSMP